MENINKEKITPSELVKRFQRNEAGLLENVDYVFDSSGKVDWRRMVKQEFIVPNNQKTDETDVSKLEDSDLLILLAGLKNLADLRGYECVSYHVPTATDSYCCVACQIQWSPNFESGGKSVVFESIGDASPNNTEDFGKHYLAAIAENRAFARCVRNFLRVNIIAKEEVGRVIKKRGKSSNSQHVDILQKLMDERGLSFDLIKDKLVAENYPEVESVNSLEDINKEKLFDLINRLKKFKKAE
jgi:hypothetical protein